MIEPLIKDILAIPSISPDDKGCQALLAKELQALGFETEQLDKGDVSNLWAKKAGSEAATLMFAGHTDVVPVGEVSDWRFDPFTPTAHDGYLYARGAADMKVALCCMVLACKEFITDHPEHKGSIAFLVTSCEEKTSEYGTKYAIKELWENKQERPEWCIVGEASSQEQLGDQIKIGRRGSISATLKIIGKQGHVAYPHLAINPIHQACAALAELADVTWDQGNDYFMPTTCQISNIQSGVGANNVIPGELVTSFNLRYSPEIDAEFIKNKVKTILEKHQLDYEINWSHSGEPFLTKPDKLAAAVDKAIADVVDLKPAYSTAGGTSDARFIAPFGIETIELGFCNATIHQVDECILIDHINKLKDIYYQIMKHLLL